MQEAHRRFQASRKDENQRISRAKRQKCGDGKASKGIGREERKRERRTEERGYEIGNERAGWGNGAVGGGKEDVY